tara:strand:- start:3382 stop:4152 length:771 start_codon:yes stop_codon:yes gene_type:complete
MISVITITYNNLSGLKETVSSVIKYSGFSESVINELIVVDNLSIDGTDLFMRKLTNTNISLNYHRESDFGVYDAMNKGVSLSKNKYVIFINSGDLLINSIEAKDIHNINLKKYAGVAFSCIYSFGKYQRIVKARKVNKNKPRLPGLHQGMIYKKDVLLNIKYDIKFKICGDFDNVCRIYDQNISNEFLINKKVISSLKAGGISSQKPFILFMESTSIVFRNDSIPNYFKYIFFLRLFVRLFLFQILFRLNKLKILK